MSRILHTADVHLAPEATERRRALAATLDLAADRGVDCVTIGGDLFESERAAEALRDGLRETFSGLPFDVLAIPGNHDAAAFGTDLFFGADFQAAVAEPFEYHRVGGARITALPYTPEATPDLLVDLADREPFDGPEALLFHCSLEAPMDGGVGDEGETRYFPITEAQLAELGFDYYLAGHYHSPHTVGLPGGGRFVYPGTPASVTRSETGPRGVVLLDTDEGSLERHRLDTFHYDRLELTATPGDEDRIPERIRETVAEWEGREDDRGADGQGETPAEGERTVEGEIVVDGFVDAPEEAFAERLAEAAGGWPLENRTRSASAIRDHPLYEAFEAELADHEVEPEAWDSRERLREATREETLAVFAELAAAGELS